MNNKNVNIDLIYINLLEKQISYINNYKFNLINNKPLWFQKNKLKVYKNNIKKIDNKLDVLNKKLLDEYLKVEEKK